MNGKDDIKVVDECAFCRPQGRVTMEQAVAQVIEAIRHCRANAVPQLMFNGHGLTGFPSPSLPERYFIARQLAAAAEGQVQVGLVVHAHMIDPEKFGIQVARNAGMNADVFDNEPAALAWLLLRAGT